ncbi:MAG: pseudouridine-5'-phosphate glycosidase [Flavobacteriales bacterium]|nr:pseudouridine-5'-phosphate glycosidase [Flavobacteriales bacterium]
MLRYSDEVREAIDSGKALVALESTIIVHGMPWPRNVEVAQRLEEAVRASGAVPATIAIMEGQPVIGLEASELEKLADGKAHKISTREIAWAIASKATAATTVASTMSLAAMAGIHVFATGGIGGVHRGGGYDESADLTELSRTRVLVVSAGAKAILDLSATLERLETLSVPVIGYRTGDFPSFYSTTSGLPVSVRLDEVIDIARVAELHWKIPGSGGLLVANPVPQDVAIQFEEVEKWISEAMTKAQFIRGKALTPFLLKCINESTKGRSQSVNEALALNNASLAGSIAVAMKANVDRAL